MKPLIILGVTGSIAAVRAFDLARELRRKGFEVQVVMSRDAQGIITEQAMEFASGKKVISSISGMVEHVKFFGRRGKAALLLIAPATANTISKIAMGIDDTPVTTFASIAIGSGKPVLLAPAMHEPMYEHPIVMENLAKLGGRGVKVIVPLMEEGKAKLQNIEEIVFEAEKALAGNKLKGKKILVASGSFQQKIDDVRVITNNSSGKMGKEIALECMRQKGQVKVVGNGVNEGFVDFELVKEADELERKVMKELARGYDYFFCPAAIPDFGVRKFAGKMSSKKPLELKLLPRTKLLQNVRQKFPSLKIIAFKAMWGKSKKEIGKATDKFKRENGFFAVVGTDLKKNPPGSESGEFFYCGTKKKWVKGSKREVARKIIEIL